MRVQLLTAKLSLLELVAWGVLYYSFASYLPVMHDELGWSPTLLAAGFSLALLVSGVSAPFVGKWIDRHGSRALMVWGTVVGSLGVVLWSCAYTIPVYFAAWTLIGLSMAGTLYAPAFATMVRFQQGDARNSILAITLVAALASTVFLPFSSFLTASLGWRTSLQILALVMATVTVPLALKLPRDSETFRPTFDTSTDREERVPVIRQIRMLSTGLTLAETASVAFHAHLIVFLVDQGTSLQAAASIAGLAGLAKIAGRVATIYRTKLSALTLLSRTTFLQSVTLLLPVFWPTPSAAIVMVVVFGATSGARTILSPAIIVEMYGIRRFASNNGLLQLYTTSGKALGPIGMGVLVSTLGGLWSWSILALVVAVSGGLLLLTRQDISIDTLGATQLERTICR